MFCEDCGLVLNSQPIDRGPEWREFEDVKTDPERTGSTCRVRSAIFPRRRPSFWYAPEEELTPAEIVCHTLLLDSGSRQVSYSVLLIETPDIDQETPTETAQKYDLEPTVDVLYRPLQGDFDSTDNLPVILPKKAENIVLKEQYGVL